MGSTRSKHTRAAWQPYCSARGPPRTRQSPRSQTPGPPLLRSSLIRVPWARNVPLSTGVERGMPSTAVPTTHRDLLDADTAIFATVGADGRPQLSAVWFLADEETIRISLNSSRQKVRNLRANPAATFFILDQAAPTRYLEVRGDAELTDDPEYAFADEVGQKYGVDLRRSEEHTS